MTENPSKPNEWTAGATALWNEYAERVIARVDGEAADPAEVVSDLRAHLDEEIRRRSYHILTRADLVLLLRQFGLPEVEIPEAAARKPGFFRRMFSRRVRSGLSWIFLVLLPLFVLFDELLFRDATLHFGNLFPHPLLWALAFFVPMEKTWYLLRMRKSTVAAFSGWEAFALGFSGLVSGWFALLLLPMAPISAFALLFFWMGFGFLGLMPLSPAFCALHSLWVWFRMAGRRPKNVLLGGLAACAVLVTAYIPVVRLERALAAAIENPERIPELRKIVSTSRLRERLFGPARKIPVGLFFLETPYLNWAERQKLFYRVTGEVPLAPTRNVRGWLLRDLNRWDEEDWESWRGWDPNQGGTEIGRVLPDVKLDSSRLDVSADPGGMLAYSEWTMVFANSGGNNAEARFLLRVPEAAVVSRVTLWIDGESREAAFGPTAQTRRAYTSVVQRNRDPLLVTSKGPNRFLVQCFPILPGSTMKIRVGVTSPLSWADDSSARYDAPEILAANFDLDRSQARHHVWLESDQDMQGWGKPSTLVNREGKAFHTLESRLSLEALREQPPIWKDLTPQISYATSPKLGEGISAVIQHWDPPVPSKGMIVVVDRSLSMKPHAALLRDLFASAPPAVLGLVVSGEIPAAVPLDKAAEVLADRAFVGGQNPVPALVLALHEAEKLQADTLLWIHAPTPYLLEGAEALQQFAERRPGAARIVSLPVSAGHDAFIPSLGMSLRFSEKPAQLPPRGFGISERRVPRYKLGGEIPVDAVKTSDHLVRLWANHQIREGLLSGSDGIPAAQRLGIEHQLVTPVTGAVVLETAAQFAANGLEAVDASSVPSIPEPETWLLLITLLGVGAWLFWRERSPA